MSSHDKLARSLAVARILLKTANMMGCKVEQIIARDVGNPTVSKARMAFCYIIRPILQNHETGAILGRRNSGTIDSSWRRCLKVMQSDKIYRDKVNTLLEHCDEDREKYQLSKKFRV
jgi:chromosomal replication initiation ATPase DnaA